MPTYDFYCTTCDTTTERNVKADLRDSQECKNCMGPLERKWTFKGSVWAPTSTGGGSKV